MYMYTYTYSYSCVPSNTLQRQTNEYPAADAITHVAHAKLHPTSKQTTF